MPNKLKITESISDTFVVQQVIDTQGSLINLKDYTGDVPSKIIVTIEATHTGINHNHVEYTGYNMEKSTPSWTKDYAKPVLLNHYTSSDPIGRVLTATYCQSVLDASKYCIKLDLEILNKEAIERFLDGRYKTFSIGGVTDSITCSICGKDQMKDGWCGHRRGHTYDNKKCYLIAGVIDYHEISVVNLPADVNAQALEIKIVTEDGRTADFNESNILALIDSTLNQPIEPPVEPDTHDNVEQYKAWYAEKTIALTESQARCEQLESQLTDTKQTCKTLQDEKALKDEENKILFNQNVELAKAMRQMLCDRLFDIALVTKQKVEDERVETMNTYKSLTSLQLNDAIQTSIKEALVEPTPQKAPQVTPPVLVDNTDSNVVITNEESQQKTSFEDTLASVFRKKYY